MHMKKCGLKDIFATRYCIVQSADTNIERNQCVLDIGMRNVICSKRREKKEICRLLKGNLLLSLGILP